MTRLRVVPYRDLRRVADAAGFRHILTRGSHNVFRHADGRTVVIPDHGSQEIVRPLTRKIVRDLGLSIDEYHDLLDQI